MTIVFQNVVLGPKGRPVYNTVARLSGSLILRMSETPVPITAPAESGHVSAASAGDGAVELTSPEVGDGNAAARDSVLAHYASVPVLTSLSGVDAGPDGRLFINGSDCTTLSQSYDSAASTITIVDVCRACSGACSTFINVRKWIEYYEIALNMLKDVNLYTDFVAGTRYNWMANHPRRISIPAGSGCAQEITAPSDVSALRKNAYELLYQYAMMVQMWNYAVSISGNKTEIVSAPEDASGFIVQSKFSVPDCTKQSELQDTYVTCTILVKPVKLQGMLSNDASTVVVDGEIETPVQDAKSPVSLYAAAGTVSCRPFGDGNSSGYSPSVSCTPAGDYGRAKRIVYSMRVKNAGTYVVAPKFIPFIAMGFKCNKPEYLYMRRVRVYNGADDTEGYLIDVAEPITKGEYDYWYIYDVNSGRQFIQYGDLQQEGSDGYGNVAFGGDNLAGTNYTAKLKARAEYRIYVQPTRQQYSKLRSFASSSVDIGEGNIFEIDVSWAVTKGGERKYGSTETYTYAAKPCRDFDINKYGTIYSENDPDIIE